MAISFAKNFKQIAIFHLIGLWNSDSVLQAVLMRQNIHSDYMAAHNRAMRALSTYEGAMSEPQDSAAATAHGVASPIFIISIPMVIAAISGLNKLTILLYDAALLKHCAKYTIGLDRITFAWGMFSASHDTARPLTYDI